MRKMGWCLLVSLAVIVPVLGDDPPGDEKKPPTPKEQFQALVKEFQKKQADVLAEIRKAKGDEQQELFQKYSAVGKEFAEKFYKLAEDHPKDPMAADAIFWIVQNAAGSPVYKKASDKAADLIHDMPVQDILNRLRMMRTGNTAVLAAVVKRAESAGDDEKAADLLAWVANSGAASADAKKAIQLLIEKFPDHRSIEQMCASLGRRYSPQGLETLKQIYEKSSKANIKAAAALGLGKCLASQADSLGDKPSESDRVAAEAEKYLQQVIDEFGKDSAAKRKDAEKALHVLRTLRVGKEAPEIEAPDLDGQDFKLSDYRGKVVLLDFWGHW